MVGCEHIYESQARPAASARQVAPSVTEKGGSYDGSEKKTGREGPCFLVIWRWAESSEPVSAANSLYQGRLQGNCAMADRYLAPRHR